MQAFLVPGVSSMYDNTRLAWIGKYPPYAQEHPALREELT